MNPHTKYKFLIPCTSLYIFSSGNACGLSSIDTYFQILNASQVLNWHIGIWINLEITPRLSTFFLKNRFFNRWGYIWCNTQSLTPTSQDLEWVNNRESKEEKKRRYHWKKWSSRQAISNAYTIDKHRHKYIYITFECPIKLRSVSFICENQIIFSHTTQQNTEIIN